MVKKVGIPASEWIYARLTWDAIKQTRRCCAATQSFVDRVETRMDRIELYTDSLSPTHPRIHTQKKI